MSKRGAIKELTDRNWDDEEEPEEAGIFVQANKDVLSKRVIKKAKRKVVGEDGAQGGSNAFAGFAGFGSKVGSNTGSGFTGFSLTSSNTSTPSAGISFGSASKPSSLSNGAGTDASAAGFKLSPFVVGTPKQEKKDSEPSERQTAESGSKDSENKVKYLQQLRSLNESVSKWIKQHVEKNPVCILTPIFKDYEQHLASIEKKYPHALSKNGTETKSIEKTITDEAPSKTKATESSSVMTPASQTSPITTSSTGTSGSSSAAPSAAGSLFGSGTPSSGFKLTPSTTTSATPGLFGSGLSSGIGFGSSASGFKFSASATSSDSKPFTFAASKPKEEGGTAASNTGTEEDEYEPPKPEVTMVTEEDAFYTKLCKLYFKSGDEWKEKGKGNLYLKKLEDNKTQLLIRADTNLGNILLNIKLGSSIPVSRQGKNNVSIFCIPNPPLNPKADSTKPVGMLVRVKTGADADELYEKMTEVKTESS